MFRQAAALLFVVAGAALAAQSPSAPTPATVVVRKDKVTAALERVPAATVVAAIIEQTGAELRGDVPPGRTVTLELHDAPLEEALERILGEQSFTLTYEGDGRLKRIALGGPATSPASPGSSATTGTPAPGSPNDEVVDATRRVAEFVQGDPTVPVGGRLAKALGTDTTTFTQVLGAALKHEDAHVRAAARRATVKALAADPEVRTALATTIDAMTDDAITRALRAAAGADAERLATALARHGRSPVLARRMQRALSQLRAHTGGS